MSFLSELFGKGEKTKETQERAVAETVSEAETPEEDTAPAEGSEGESDHKEETVGNSYKFETLQLHVGQEQAVPARPSGPRAV